MKISERIFLTIENWQEEWKDRLRGWMASWLGFGMEVFFDILGRAAAPKLKPLIDSIEATGKVPPELQPLLDEMKSPTGEVGAMFSQSAGSALVGGALGKIIDALFLPLAYGINSVTRNVELSASQYMGLWLRGVVDDELLDKRLSWFGLHPDTVPRLKELTQIRLDPMSIVTAWRRDPEKYAGLFSDLKDQGWSEDRIEALKFFTLFLPSADEQTLWLAREVYEPDMIEKYGLDAELPVYEDTDFAKIGVSREQAINKWRAHWEHASWMQVVEMLHRGLVTEEEVYDWFRVVEIVPYWRDLLIQTAYTWPTRVDVRRWWDMRTIDETELRRLYSGMGYRGVNLDNYVLWTKVYVAFPDLMARWTKGWITIDDVRTKLTALGMPAERVEEMIQMKVKPEEPGRVEEGRSLTKTEIYKGVKKELITWSEGIELLMDLGYDYDEANYILTVNVGALEGSPETFEEFKDLTSKYKIAAGREVKPLPDELKEAADELVKAKLEVDALERAVKEERRLFTAAGEAPAAATRKLKKLEVALNRARSELQRIQLDYNSKVAAWKHGEPLA